MEILPVGGDWPQEIKYDARRTQLAIDGDQVRIHTCHGGDWSEKYAGVDVRDD